MIYWIPFFVWISVFVLNFFKFYEFLASVANALPYLFILDRAAIEFEKKVHADNTEQSQIMENNMVLMAREIEKLHAELANTEKKAQVAAAASANSGTLT